MCAVICQYDPQAAAPDATGSIRLALAAMAADPAFTAGYNTWPGMDALVLTGFPNILPITARFGMTPAWSDKPMFLFNARAEGKLNAENSPHYSGEKGIFSMPSFRQAIRERRCLVPVNAFVEGTEKERLSKPFVIRRKDEGLFFLGGIWEEWTDRESGEIVRGFAVITTAAAPLLQALPHHRSPLVLPSYALEKWLNPQTSSEVIDSLLIPFDSALFTATPISPGIKYKVNAPHVLDPYNEQATLGL